MFQCADADRIVSAALSSVAFSTLIDELIASVRIYASGDVIAAASLKLRTRKRAFEAHTRVRSVIAMASLNAEDHAALLDRLIRYPQRHCALVEAPLWFLPSGREPCIRSVIAVASLKHR